MTTRAELDVLLACVDQAYNRKSWHGTNLRGSLRGVSAKTAAQRPGPERHNIWELTVHAAYWKYAVWRRLSGQSRGSFTIRGSNWFPRPDRSTSEASWRRDIALLDNVHAEMREVIADLTPRELFQTPKGSKVSNFALISGIAAHDLYHAGQIQLLKRLVT